MGRTLALAALLVALGAPAFAADVPSSLRVQGVLLTSSGAPATGPVDLRIGLFDVSAGGNELFAKTFLATPLERGVYDVTLDGIPQTLFEQYVSVWLEAKVASETPLPRQRLLSHPYAMQARHADEAEVALDLLCTECIGAGALAGGSVTSAALASGSVGPSHVTFSYAAGATKGGAATGLQCIGCVDATDLAPSSIASAHIQDGAIAAADMGFNYAASASKGGAATGLQCTGCVTGGHIADHVALGGNPTVAGGLSVCTAGQSGCGIDIAGLKLTDKKDGWLTLRASGGLRVRNAGDTGWAQLAFGGGTVTGDLTVDPGALTVSGAGAFGGNVVIGSSGQGASLAVFGGVQVGADAATCTSAKAGTLRWNGGDKVMEVCDGSAWTQSLGGGSPVPALGQSQGTAGHNCTQILLGGASTGDGVYWIDPDADGNTSNAYQAFCDMTTDGGGWTLVAYAGSNAGGFPRMDIDVGAYSASFRTGKASRSALIVAKQSVDMALGYHPTQNFSGSLSQMTDAVALRIPDPAVVDLKTSGNNGTCTAVRAWRLKPDGSIHECVGSSSNGTNGISASDCNEAAGQAHAGVWSKSLGGTYAGVFAYGVYGTEWECNSWPNVSHHWWVDSQYYNWEPSATQYWDGAVNGTTSIWFRGDVNLPKPKNTLASAEASCKTILQNGHSTGDGVYWVDPDGGSTGNAHQTYCDMTTAGGGWTLVAYAGHSTYGFPRMDLDVGTFHPTIRGGKAAKSAVALTRMSTEMALSYSPQTAHGGSMAETTDTVSFTIPSPASVDLVPSANSGACVAVAARRLKPNGSVATCIGSSSNPAGISASNCNPVNGAATAGVWSKSLGGNYNTFAYGLFGTEWNCNNWPNISHHWWIDTPSYNWEPSATQYWAGAINGSTAVWVR